MGYMVCISTNDADFPDVLSLQHSCDSNGRLLLKKQKVFCEEHYICTYI